MSKQPVIDTPSDMGKPTTEKDAWSFPDMDLGDELRYGFDAGNEVKTGNQKDEQNKQSTKPQSISPEELLRIKEEHEKEIILIKSEYDKKIESVNKLLSELENPLTIFDTELIDLMHVMIKKVATKIIYKEIESDPAVITSMVEELKKIVQEDNNEIATIYLSEVDHKKLNNKNKTPKLSISIDEKLHEGDIIIKSKLGDIKAILVERIDQILGNKHG